MSHQQHTHGDAHAHASHDDMPHGTMKDYVIGFVLSVILTAIPFWLVMGDVLESKSATVGWILFLGLLQIIVHLVFFLHLKPSAEGGWILMSAVFTVITIVIALVGSIWVMNALQYHMMPHTHEGTPYEPESARDITITR